MNVFKAFLLLTLLLLFTCPSRAEELDDLIAREIKSRNIPGLSIAVIRDGKVLRAGGYGLANIELKVPATKDTVYEIGSISKQFASEAIMLLVEDGRLNLDDPINKYLPNPPASWAKITIRQVLNHTAGLKDWTEVKGFSYRREYTADEFIDLIRSFPLQYQPGDSWAYTNSGPPLLGIVVEKASGNSYEDFVNKRIIGPLALPSISFRHQESIVPNRASGYEFANGGFTNGEPLRPKIIAPSGGILASAIDLARWFEAVLEGRVVKPSSLREMLAPARPSDGRNVTHGFAFFTDSFNGYKMIFHHGSTVGGFGSVVKYYPTERITIAVMGNLEDGGWGPDYLIKRIAGQYIPGAFIGTIKEGPDPDPKLSGELLRVLKDLAAGKSSDMVATGYAGRITPEFKKQISEYLADLRSFTFLAAEKIGSDHFVLDKTLSGARHYRLNSGTKKIYFTFRIDDRGKVGFILTDL